MMKKCKPIRNPRQAVLMLCVCAVLLVIAGCFASMLATYKWAAQIIFIVLLVICALTKYDPTFVWVLIGLSQLVQVIIILYQLIKKKKFLLSIAAVVLYVIGSVSIVILASCLVFIFKNCVTICRYLTILSWKILCRFDAYLHLNFTRKGVCII